MHGCRARQYHFVDFQLHSNTARVDLIVTTSYTKWLLVRQRWANNRIDGVGRDGLKKSGVITTGRRCAPMLPPLRTLFLAVSPTTRSQLPLSTCVEASAYQQELKSCAANECPQLGSGDQVQLDLVDHHQK